jgi:mono/diheme cytochrome c family protein
VASLPVRAEPGTATGGSEGGSTDGKSIFAEAGCGGCHTLKAAGATGTVGPNLDDAKPAKDLVIDRVTNGKGVMPSFKGDYSAEQIAAVADFVVASAGK